MLPVVVDFLRLHPHIDARLVLSDRWVHLLDDHVDVAVRVGALPDSSLIAMGLGTVRQVVCASPSYLAQRGVPGSPSDLGGHDCVAFETLSAGKSWIFGTGRSEIAIPLHFRLRVNTAEAAIDAALAGVGLTRVLSYQVADAVRAGALRIVLAEFEPPPCPVNLIHGAQGPLPLKLRALLDFARKRLGQRLSEVAGNLFASRDE